MPARIFEALIGTEIDARKAAGEDPAAMDALMNRIYDQADAVAKKVDRETDPACKAKLIADFMSQLARELQPGA